MHRRRWLIVGCRMSIGRDTRFATGPGAEAYHVKLAYASSPKLEGKAPAVLSSSQHPFWLRAQRLHQRLVEFNRCSTQQPNALSPRDRTYLQKETEFLGPDILPQAPYMVNLAGTCASRIA